MSIPIKSDQELEAMRQGGKILAEVLKKTCQYAKPGLSTHDLDQFAEKLIKRLGGIPGFKGYKGFPATLCTCINEKVVHGIPREDEILQEGQLLTIDCGLIYKGLYTDAARSIAIGEVDDEMKRFIRTAYKILKKVIKRALPGTHLGEIGKFIEKQVKSAGYDIVRDLTGHGVGRKLHEDPIVLNYWDGKKGPTLMPGMTLAIEPIFAMGKGKIKTLQDKWTIVTKDNSPAIQVEQTIAIIEDGNEILTA